MSVLSKFLNNLFTVRVPAQQVPIVQGLLPDHLEARVKVSDLLVVLGVFGIRFSAAQKAAIDLLAPNVTVSIPVTILPKGG
jgi:hypothetical protein